MKKIAMFLVAVSFLTACQKDDVLPPPTDTEVSNPELTEVSGFYLLNEGSMGSNNATLDYYDYSKGVYTTNLYPTANPDVPMDLGDLGVDMAIYGNRLYTVINGSNKVEVMDAATARRIGQVEIPNCRYIKFHEGYAYVTSYAGPVEYGSGNNQVGYVAKVDTASLAVVDRCLVGYQPDGLEIVGGKIYVANSGGYMYPLTENTLSVIDIASFTEEERIPVAINMQYVIADDNNCLWISSRGDYYETPSRLYCYDIAQHAIVAQLEVPVSDICIDDNNLYIISSSWNNLTYSYDIAYAKVNVDSRTKVADNFIDDGSDADIIMPYGIAVNPVTKDILITDVHNYVTPGTVYCFDATGKKKWSARTGVIPAHITFTGK